MKIIPRTLGADTIAFSANATGKIDLPRNHRIQRMVLELTGTYSVTTFGATDDALHGLINAIRVKRNGTDPVRNLPAAYLAKINYFDYGRSLSYVAPTGDGAGQAFRAVYVIDFRRDRKNATDVFGALDAKNADSLKLEIDWGAATDIGSGVSALTNTQVKVTLYEAQMTPAEERRIYGSQDLLEYQTYNQKTVDAAYNDYQFFVNVPAGNIVEKIMVVARSAGALSDALVTRYKVKQYAPNPIDLQDYDWYSSQEVDRLDYALVATAAGNISQTGATIIDFEDQGHLDMRGAKEGDAKILMTTAAPSGTTDVTIIPREWVPQNAGR